MNDEYFMRAALELARQAEQPGRVGKPYCTRGCNELCGTEPLFNALRFTWKIKFVNDVASSKLDTAWAEKPAHPT